MSYYVSICFKQLSDNDDIMEILSSINEDVWEQRNKIIVENRHCIPSLNKDGCDRDEDKYWASKQLSTKVLYWKNLKLIGIICDQVKGGFDTVISFQDSTDQDYEYEYWGDKIEIFNELREKAKKLSIDEIAEIQNQRFNRKETFEDDLENYRNDTDYYKRSCLYELIEDKLGIERYLYNMDGEVPIKIEINPVHSLERLVDLSTTIQRAKDRG